MNQCKVCLTDDVRPAFDTNGFTLSRCNRCSHMWVSSGVSADILAVAYGQDYYAVDSAVQATGYQDYLHDADIRSRGFKERLNFVEQHVPGRGRILDYGCAVGLFVKVAADSGWEAVGYERSEWAANYGRQELGLNIVVGDGTKELPFEKPFDVITMWDAAEHLDDPRGVLSAVANLLKPGGLLAMNTVNGSSLGARVAGRQWRHILPPHHLQFFTRASLRRLLDDVGLDIVLTQSRGVMFGAKKATQPLGAVAERVERLATHWRFAPMANWLNLLDEIEIYAVKR